MKEYTILTVNPGSSSTKLGLVKGGKIILDINVDNQPGEFDGCATFADQVPQREKKIFDMLANEGVDLNSIDAVSGRGVGVHSCTGGTYYINDLAYEHALNDVEGIRHPATLGIVLAYRLGKQLDKPAFFVNPMNVDELCDEARLIGVKGIYRPARSHPLNMKQVAINHSKLQGTRYEDCNYVILHMGGGISVGAHCHGKAIDGTRSGDGQGPLAPNRAGELCAGDVFTLLDNGIPLDQVKKLCSGNGGFKDLLGTDDMRKIKGEMIPAGNKLAKLAVDTMEYHLVKWAAMMAGALRGQVDAVLLTGGLANDKELVAQLTEDLSWIAPVYVYPGSFETEALGAGVERVLTGEEEAKVYTGKPVWDGFEFDN